MEQYNLYYLDNEEANKFLYKFSNLFVIASSNKTINYSKEVEILISQLDEFLTMHNLTKREVKNIIFVLSINNKEQNNFDSLNICNFFQRYNFLHKTDLPIVTIWTIFEADSIKNINICLERYILIHNFALNDIVNFDLEDYSETNLLVQAIIIKGMELIPNSFRIHYVPEDKKIILRHTYNFSKELKDEMLLQLAHTYIKSHHYKAILSLSPGITTYIDIHKLIELYDHINLLSFTYEGNSTRMNQERLLFTNCIRIAKKHKLYDYVPIIEEMEMLRREEQIAFIKLLYFQMVRYFKEQNYIDYVVRLYRLLEEILIYAMGWDVNRNGTLYKKKQHAWPNLLEKEKKIYRLLLKEFKKMVNSRNEYMNILNSLEDANVNKLIEFRHESVGGHGFSNIGENDIEDIFQYKDYNQEIYNIMIDLNIPVEGNYYDLLDHLLILEIEDYISYGWENKNGKL